MEIVPKGAISVNMAVVPISLAAVRDCCLYDGDRVLNTLEWR
jgi:hypothetical protein